MSSPVIAAVFLLALAVLVGGRWLRAWRRQWRHARHVVRVTEEEAAGPGFFGSMSLEDRWAMRPVSGEHALNHEHPFLAAPLPGPGASETELADYWLDPALQDRLLAEAEAHGWHLPAPEPTAAEVAASRAAHGYIPELDTDPGPGGEERSPGPACPRCGVAHREPHCADGREWGPWPPDRYVLEVDRLPRMGPASLERLADTGDIRDAALLADAAAFMRDQDAEVADWLAGRAIVWARLEIGALA